MKVLDNTPLVLALDVGSSSCRLALCGSDSLPEDDLLVQVPYRPRLSLDGGAVLDPERLLTAIVGGLDLLYRRAGPRASRVRAAGISAFWHSLVGVSDQGTPSTPIYLWLDRRGAEQAQALRDRLDEKTFHAVTGCVFHPSYPMVKLAWLRAAHPEQLRQVRYWMGFGDLLLLTLLGEPLSSLSLASGSGLLDQQSFQWCEQVLNAVGVSPDALPALRSGADPLPSLLPKWAERWPSWRKLVWYPAIGDGAASNLGSGCSTRDRLALMIGTSGAMRLLWRSDEREMPWGLWGYLLDRDWRCMGGALNDGGGLKVWLKEQLGFDNFGALEDTLSHGAPDGHGLTVLPLWAGERSPSWALGSRGAIVGLSSRTTRADIVRASLEAVALWFGEIFNKLGSRAQGDPLSVVATGGALLRSPAWMQIVADVLGHEVVASDVPEASLRGAALWARSCSGLLEQPLETLRPPLGQRYAPRSEAFETYRRAGERQRSLYAALANPR